MRYAPRAPLPLLRVLRSLWGSNVSEFFVPCDDKYAVPDQEGVFVVPETTIIQHPGVTWAFARVDGRIIYERAPEHRVFERAPENPEFQGDTS